MKDKELDRIIREALSYEDEKLMDIVRNEPSLADVKAPDSLKEKLFAQIEEYKEEQARIEEEERVKRLERKYKRAVRWNKALVIMAALVAVMALGITSMGGPKRVLEEFKRKIGGREQSYVNSDDGSNKTGEMEKVTEEESYTEIEKVFGQKPVKLDYLPKTIFFSEMILEKEIPNARLYYENKAGDTISYVILFNYLNLSTAVDADDPIEREFCVTVENTEIRVTKHKVDGSNMEKWRAEFTHKDALHYIEFNGIEEVEVKKIIENLYFF